jgi:hypothetical protein
MADKQPELFPEPAAPQLSDEEAARHIGENARPVDYPDRTSEAARDQGWGPAETQDTAKPTEDTELKASPFIPVEHRPIEENIPTDEESENGKQGVKAARAVLKASTPHTWTEKRSLGGRYGH